MEVAKFGTPPHKLHRTDSIDTSVEAAKKVDSTRLEKMVYDAVKSFGDVGCIQDQVLALPQFATMPYSSVTARFSSLLTKKFIEDTLLRRKGNSGRSQRVVKVTTDLNKKA